MVGESQRAPGTAVYDLTEYSLRSANPSRARGEIGLGLTFAGIGVVVAFLYVSSPEYSLTGIAAVTWGVGFLEGMAGLMFYAGLRIHTPGATRLAISHEGLQFDYPKIKAPRVIPWTSSDSALRLFHYDLGPHGNNFQENSFHFPKTYMTEGAWTQLQATARLQGLDVTRKRFIGGSGERLIVRQRR